MLSFDISKRKYQPITYQWDSYGFNFLNQKTNNFKIFSFFLKLPLLYTIMFLVTHPHTRVSRM